MDKGPQANPRSKDWLAERLRGYDAIQTALDAVLNSATYRKAPVAERIAWDAALLELFDANLGDAAVIGYLQLSARWSRYGSFADAAEIGLSVKNIGQLGGSRVAQAVLTELRNALGRIVTISDLHVVLAALHRIAVNGPESLAIVVGRLQQLLSATSAAGFSAWVSAGLRAAGCSAAHRRAFFGLEDALSTRLLNEGSNSGDEFSRLEKHLSTAVRALWNTRTRLRRLPPGVPAVPRRVSLAGGLLGLPASYPGFEGNGSETIYLAASMHAGAHLRHSTKRFPVERLKPLQIALTSLIEDARVEALALRDFPGLRRLWLPFHTVVPSAHATAVSLMARLARALIDPGYTDPDAWITKGRAQFAARADRWDDPTISREIGGLLGNDIGQMRLQFNARSYVVEPVYRDDNLALWDFENAPDARTDEIEVPAESVCLERKLDNAGDKQDDSAAPEEVLRARSRTATMLDGLPIAHYSEWDYEARVERPDWTTILESDAPALGALKTSEVDTEATRRLSMIARNVSIGRRQRLKSQREGDTLDVDAAIGLMSDRRAGLFSEPSVYIRAALGPRDLAVLLLLDLSQSTADRDPAGYTILDMERTTGALIAAAIEAAGDAIAIHGFNSDGRKRVKYLRIKSFEESMDAVIASRLGALHSSHSTRLGAALRHAGGYLSRRHAFRKVLLVLTDGEPSDVDVEDDQYLTEDARRIAIQLRGRGIDVFAFGLGSGPFPQLDRVFGERRALRVPRLKLLPQRIMQLYTELKK